MNLLFWVGIIGSIGVLCLLVFIVSINEIKAKKLRKTLKVGDKVFAHISHNGACIGEVIEIKNDDKKTVKLSVITTLDRIYPLK